MKYLMLVVRLLDILTGSGFYELTRYNNGTGLNLSTSKFMAWRHRTARRLWSLEAAHMIVPFVVMFSILLGISPFLAATAVTTMLFYMVIVVVLIILFPPIAIILL
jgi:hypothetical protein